MLLVQTMYINQKSSLLHCSVAIEIWNMFVSDFGFSWVMPEENLENSPCLYCLVNLDRKGICLFLLQIEAIEGNMMQHKRSPICLEHSTSLTSRTPKRLKADVTISSKVSPTSFLLQCCYCWSDVYKYRYIFHELLILCRL